MNRDEALRCIEISKKYFSDGDKSKALKFAQKSLSLCSTQEGEDWIAALQTFPSPPVPKKSYQEKTNSTESPPIKREYTVEQVEAVKQIKRCGNDYYAILGLSREFSDAEIKKSYRKLALQFHPDKNSAPGASEAFKSIGQAYTTLSDPSKKDVYDRYGTEGLKTARQTSNHGHGERMDGEMTPEELFNLFFGGDLAGSTFLH